MLRGSGGFKGASMGERKNTAAVSTVLFVFHCTVGVEIDLLLEGTTPRASNTLENIRSTCFEEGVGGGPPGH